MPTRLCEPIFLGSLMPLAAINHPEYWRNRATEARAVAAQTRDTHIKALMLKFAQDYEKLAVRAEQRGGDNAQPCAKRLFSS